MAATRATLTVTRVATVDTVLWIPARPARIGGTGLHARWSPRRMDWAIGRANIRRSLHIGAIGVVVAGARFAASDLFLSTP